MSEKLKTIRSLEEFQRLYYPNDEPALDYFNGGEPDDGPARPHDDEALIVDLLDGVPITHAAQSA